MFIIDLTIEYLMVNTGIIMYILVGTLLLTAGLYPSLLFFRDPTP
jgi:hypothetical protein